MECQPDLQGMATEVCRETGTEEAQAGTRPRIPQKAEFWLIVAPPTAIKLNSRRTATPAGRAMFGMLGIFSEFEREVIVARVNAGLARSREAIARDGHFTSKVGKVRKRLGRPNADPKKLEAARCEFAKGTGVLKTAKLVGLGTGTVQRLKHAAILS
jgi:DNA invertase Pin-like site-specific DNA recombinase